MDSKLIILLLIVCHIENSLNVFVTESFFTMKRFCNEDVKRDLANGHHICNYQCYHEYPIIEKNVTCSYVPAADLQIIINSWATEDHPVTFKMIDSDIPVWPASAFKDKQKVFALYLEELNIQKLMPGAFNYLDSLNELHLKGNNLTTISDGLFNSLTQLEELDLSRNQIQNITNHAFIGGKLRTLLLNNNNISQIEQELIDSLMHLKTFNISNNHLRETNNFSELSLHTLSMSNNELNSIDFELLQSVQSEIDLSFNNVSELVNFDLLVATKLTLSHNNIRELERNDNILRLDVSYNQLKAIGSNLFGSRSTDLYLGTNYISTITTDAFLGLENLEYLTLDNNNLSSIPNSCFKDLVSLVLLDLSGNKLTHFTYGTFDNLVKLETLNISGNQLIDIQDIFHATGNLRNLYFANNEISDIDVNNLLRMEHLKEVDLKDNTWACKKLVNIVHRLKAKQITFYNGEYWEESNIHGIKCYETLDISTAEGKADVNLGDSKLSRFYNEDFTKTVMYKYFNKEFKDSNFFKYLESLKNTLNDTYMQNLSSKYIQALITQIKSKPNNESNNDFTKTAVYNYFNEDFRKSGFFKYLENFKEQENKQIPSQNAVQNQLQEVITILKNVSEKKSTNLLSNTSDNTYNYFNKDFNNSNFFKYLENLNSRILVEKPSDNVDDSKMEKLISTIEGEKATSYSINYTGLLSFIVILLVIVACVQIVTTYLNIMRIKKYSLAKKEDVELI